MSGEDGTRIAGISIGQQVDLCRAFLRTKVASKEMNELETLTVGEHRGETYADNHRGNRNRVEFSLYSPD